MQPYSPKERMKETLAVLGGWGWYLAQNSSLLAPPRPQRPQGEASPKETLPSKEHVNQEWRDHQEGREAGLIFA